MAVVDPVLPYLFGMVADRLLGNALFASLIPGGILPKAPEKITDPFAVMLVSASPLGGDGVAWRAGVALNGCAVDWIGQVSPEQWSWDIAAAAAAVFHRSRNVTVGRVTYTAAHTDGPLVIPPDKSRGDAIPVYGTQVRADLTIHLR